MCTRMAPEIVMFPSSPLSHSEPAFQGVFRAVPEGPSPRGGSFQFDSRPNRLPLEWSSEAEFHSWLAAEQASNSVEFVVRNTRYPKSDALKQLWTKEITYVCGRAATGGRKSYIKKTSREQKLSSKKIPGGCTAKIVFKSYPTTLSVRGKYISSHTHATGDDNLKFTRVSRETRARIAALLRQGLEPKLVLKQIHDGACHGLAQDGGSTSQAAHRRDGFVTIDQIRRIQKQINAENARLHTDDGQSTPPLIQ